MIGWIYRLIHRHNWIMWKPNVIASWDKQNGQGNTIYVRGNAEICSALWCEAERFVPHDRTMRPVGFVKLMG